MSNATFNAGVDYFALESGTSNALKVTTSNENRSIQSQSGPNTFGDAAAVDSWGETAAPSAEYELVDALEHTLAEPVITLGALISAANSQISIGGTAVPVVLGSCSISTQNGSAPKLSMSGQTVHSAAAALRTYVLPAFTLSTRHRAQDFLGLCTIKKGTGTLTVADPAVDYGLEACNANFPIQFTLGQPKGMLRSYDLHGGMATVGYTMNWYASTAPTIVVDGSVSLKGASNTTITASTTVTTPVGKDCPEGGYTQYTWQVSFPLIGIEVA